MAIIPEVPGLEAQVVVNGAALKEYRTNDEAPVPPKTATHYIEAVSGAVFEIAYKFAPPFPRNRTVSMIVNVDGRDLDEPVLRPHELFDKEGHTSAGALSSNGRLASVQRFCFSTLDIEEGNFDAVSEEVKEALAEIGTITLKFYYLKNTQRNYEFKSPKKVVDGLGTVSEKAAKGEALSHQTSLRPAESTLQFDIIDGEYDGEPFAIFNFRYRSLRALKSLLIVPRTPEPQDLDVMDIEGLSEKHMRRLLRSMRARAENAARIKRESDDSLAVVGNDEDEVIYVRTKRRKYITID